MLPRALRLVLVGPILPVAAQLAACGDPLEVIDTQGGGSSTTGSTTQLPPTSAPPTSDPTTSTTAEPTDGGSGSATDSATTAGPGTSTTETSATTSSTTSTTDDPDTATDTSTTGTTSTGTTGSDDGGSASTDAVEPCACPDIEVPLDDGIFVLSSTAGLWKYFPETNEFTLLGELSCPGVLNNTFSMAVDRLGFAWVQFNDGGSLRKVDVTNVANCVDPGYVLDQQGVGNFGMAFVSNSQSDACDRIYGNTYSGFGGYTEGNKIGGFITIDPDTLALSKLGKTNFDGAELTGTGDGRAFIFGGANPSKLVEVDKSNGDTISQLSLAGVEINNSAFAFAFFAGDFYFFTDSNADFFASEVTHLDYDDSDNNGKQDLTVLVDQAPLLIVGAGVSTCAPTAPQ